MGKFYVVALNIYETSMIALCKNFPHDSIHFMPYLTAVAFSIKFLSISV